MVAVLMINHSRSASAHHEDVSAELALATITSVDVLGAFRAPKTVKAALATRTTR
jgi:hypothetical protein